MAKKTKKLVIFGVEDYAHIVHEYFSHDSDYEVAGFTIDREYVREKELFGLPVAAFEDIEKHFPPGEYDMHVACVYANMNRDRAAIIKRAKAKGYRMASYISSRAFVWRNARIGEHCFIFEDNTVQPFVAIGNNAILWSGNHIGHHSTIGDNVFISSHVVVSGWCSIGDNCFLGVNATLANNATVGRESWVMHGAVITGEVPPNSLVKSVKSEVSPLNEEWLASALKKASAGRKRP